MKIHGKWTSTFRYFFRENFTKTKESFFWLFFVKIWCTKK